VTAALVRDRYHRLHAAENPFAFFNTLGRFRDCQSRLPVQPRTVLNGRFTTHPKIMILILGRVDGF
jgi:hypothetical protein